MYVGDVQDSINGKANHFFREALQRHPDTEFFVFGGDLTERPTEQRWEETYRGLDSIGQQYPVITVTGNHEIPEIHHSQTGTPLLTGIFILSRLNGRRKSSIYSEV